MMQSFGRDGAYRLDHRSDTHVGSIQQRKTAQSRERKRETETGRQTDINSYLSYLVDTVRRKSRRVVDQEATLFDWSRVQYPWNSTNSIENNNFLNIKLYKSLLGYNKTQSNIALLQR